VKLISDDKLLEIKLDYNKCELHAKCEVHFNIKKDVEGPIFFMYYIEEFLRVTTLYKNSFYYKQMNGDPGNIKDG